MLFKTMIAAALIATPVSTAAEHDWHFAGQIAGQVMVFVDINSVEANAQPYPRGRALMVLPEGAGRFAAMNALLEFDCAAHRRRGIEAAGYDADGEVLMTAGTEDRWNDQTRTHVLWNAEEVICGRRTLTGRSYGSGIPIAEGRAILNGAEP